MTYTILATISLKPNSKTKWLERFQPLLQYVQANEPKTLVYECYNDADDDNKIVYFETYTDEDAFNAHSGSEQYQAFMESVKDLMQGPEPNKLQVLTKTGYRKQ